MIRHMDTASTCTPTVPSTKVNGRKTSNTARAKKPGLMELAMKVIMLRAKKTDSESSSGLMALPTKASSQTTTSTVEEYTSGLTTDATMDSG